MYPVTTVQVARRVCVSCNNCTHSQARLELQATCLCSVMSVDTGQQSEEAEQIDSYIGLRELESERERKRKRDRERQTERQTNRQSE